MRRPVFLLLAGILSISVLSPGVWSQCGVERWSVKTGTDSGAPSIGLSSPTPTTIANLVSLPAPNPIPVSSRVSPTETTTWTINATLTEFKLESDSDYHLVISDGSGTTMIAEIPSPNCVGTSSPFASGIAQARSKFDSAFTVSSSFQQVNVPVQITGVAMFDFLHGQTGVAQNGIEIHPVLDIVFNPTNPPPPNGFNLTASPASLGLLPGGSGSATITTATVGSFSSDVALSASGLPTGLNSSFNPITIPLPGSGSSILTLSADPSLAPGNYSFAVIGSGGGVNAQSPVAVNVCGTAPGTGLKAISSGGAQASARNATWEGTTDVHDDDDGRVQVVASEAARVRSRQHGGDLLCAPRQYDIFVGPGWKTSLPAQASLSRVTARIEATAICKPTPQAPIPAVREYSENVTDRLSDLRIQALLDSMIESHKVTLPNANAVYVLFLDSNTHVTMGGRQGGVEFLAYHNHFHGNQGEVRYIVVPFDSDLSREKRTTARAILETLNYPDGPEW
jgi:hypothetical protein